MKLFLKRDCDRFMVLDESGYEKYSVSFETDRTKQKITVETPDHKVISTISNKNMVLRYFSIKCSGRLYVLVPYMGENFAFVIYGSTYRFAGDMGNGCFSLFDVDTSPVMTQKKCWCKFGDGYELNVYDDSQEIFALSVAICAAVYVSSGNTEAVPT